MHIRDASDVQWLIESEVFKHWLKDYTRVKGQIVLFIHNNLCVYTFEQ